MAEPTGAEPVEPVEMKPPFGRETRVLAREMLQSLKEAHRYAVRIDAARALSTVPPDAVRLFPGESKPSELAHILEKLIQEISQDIFGEKALADG